VINKLSFQAITFAVIGSVGFVIDGTILTLLSLGMGINIYGSRLISFIAASLVTWRLNRKYTFIRKNIDISLSPANEYIRYIVIQIVGAVINLGVFTWLVTANPALQAIPVIPLAAGAGVALVFNFLGARIWVYQSKRNSPYE
jgi:putative flippase GtrA